MTTTVNINFSVISGWLQPGGMVNADMEKRAKRVALAAAVRAPVRSGDLRDSGSAQPGELMGEWDAVFAIHYAYFVDQGTIHMDPRHYLRNSLGVAIE